MINRNAHLVRAIFTVHSRNIEQRVQCKNPYGLTRSLVWKVKKNFHINRMSMQKMMTLESTINYRGK